MTKGVKTDELFHKDIIMEYNNKDKHNALQHDVANCKGDPAVFGQINWKQSKETLSSAMREYKRCFNSWKLSGNHGAFDENPDSVAGEPKPFSDFASSNSRLYMHEFVYQFPDVLSKVIGDLPPWAFRELIWNSNNKKKPFKKPSSRRSARLHSTEAAFKHFNLSNDKKNKIV